ncbi:MAG: hypothetical protein WCF05_06450 [Chromatiaceae bacterium]
MPRLQEIQPVPRLLALRACYGLAKLFELLDEPILRLTHLGGP